MRVCVVGAGGREHALADCLSRTAEVVCTPGNPGMADVADCTPGPPERVEADLYVIGPEAPLVDGLADRLRAAGHAVLGPGADGARLEGSKAWMKEVLVAAGVPTARHRAFAPGEAAAAAAYLRSLPGPWVVKTDGLAAGKGVLVAADVEEAVADAAAKLRTGGVVVEEGLSGPELSVLALCDGVRAVPLPAARDFKRVGEGDTGPNTGGMGAFSPVAGAGGDVVAEVMERAVLPTLAALREHGVDFRGVLYAGLMLTPDGVRVLEYNVRFGDPEAEVVLPRVEDDLAEWLRAAAEGGLPAEGTPAVGPDACVTVVMASPGYPTAPVTGARITGVERAASLPRVRVYHAGTAAAPDGGLVAAGGRVLAVTGRGPDVASARAAAYAGVDAISFDGAVVRRDIAGAG
ncbi:MAG TPA: phosphoribosylamine--glycine ligase [Acidimicrobiales bacterium]|nr:phosphoribosylamine--glycine ligase [Acidimicrobiales bacterium]